MGHDSDGPIFAHNVKSSTEVPVGIQWRHTEGEALEVLHTASMSTGTAFLITFQCSHT